MNFFIFFCRRLTNKDQATMLQGNGGLISVKSDSAVVRHQQLMALHGGSPGTLADSLILWIGLPEQNVWGDYGLWEDVNHSTLGQMSYNVKMTTIIMCYWAYLRVIYRSPWPCSSPEEPTRTPFCQNGSVRQHPAPASSFNAKFSCCCDI